jgi:hypothetical protein
MHFYPLLVVHASAGSVGFLSGTAAMILRKGSRPHRLNGNVFFVSMLIMSASGAYMAAFIQPVKINVIAGLLTFYLVATAWLTVIRKEGVTGALEYGLLLLGLLDGAGSVFFGFEAVRVAPRGWESMYFVFGALALLGAALDARMLARQGIAGAQRTRRHLWRMCVPFLIVTISLFLGTPKNVLLPPVIRHSSVRFLPSIIVFGALVFWLWRVGSRHPHSRRGTASALV